MQFQWALIFSLVSVTTQLALHSDNKDLDADDVTGPIHDFGGIFDFMTDVSDFTDPESQDDAGIMLMADRKKAVQTPGEWKAPLNPGDWYGGVGRYPLKTKEDCAGGNCCNKADMDVLYYWAEKQAKKRLPAEGYTGDFYTTRVGNNVPKNDRATCMKNNYWGQNAGLGVKPWAICYQRFYNVSTNCAECIGAVYNMAQYNWSKKCYQFCYGRPGRRDGSHWCWEDCQSCMSFIGRSLSTCYGGKSYAMVCDFAKELGIEGWFEKNGIDPKR